MIGFLRRFQPQNVALAVMYWLAWAVVLLGLLFLLFFYVDRTWDLGGRLFSPSVE